jgi:hypothetical protein
MTVGHFPTWNDDVKEVERQHHRQEENQKRQQ